MAPTTWKGDTYDTEQRKADVKEKQMSISHDDLLSLLHYDPDTGEFTWKVRKANCIAVGDRAGGVRPKDGYRMIQISGRFYLEHRLAWFYVHGQWPGDCVDHINFNKADNRIANLRKAEKWQNCCHRDLNAHAPSGCSGVNFRSDMDKWRVRVGANGKRTTIGHYDTYEEAVAARMRAKQTLCGEFSGGLQ